MTKINLDEFHYHEALDRIYIINEMIDNVLLSHPVFDVHKDLQTKISDAQTILYDVYKTLGIDNEDFTKK